MKKNSVVLLVGIALICALTGCAGHNPLEGTAGSNGVAGFWAGLLHGIISPFSFIGSLFNNDIHIYEVHNQGELYNLGFILGGAIIFGASSSRTHKHVHYHYQRRHQ